MSDGLIWVLKFQFGSLVSQSPYSSLVRLHPRLLSAGLGSSAVPLWSFIGEGPWAPPTYLHLPPTAPDQPQGQPYLSGRHMYDNHPTYTFKHGSLVCMIILSCDGIPPYFSNHHLWLFFLIFMDRNMGGLRSITVWKSSWRKNYNLLDINYNLINSRSSLLPYFFSSANNMPMKILTMERIFYERRKH